MRVGRVQLGQGRVRIGNPHHQMAATLLGRQHILQMIQMKQLKAAVGHTKVNHGDVASLRETLSSGYL